MTLIVILSMELILLEEKYLFLRYVNLYWGVKHIKHFQLLC